MQDRITTLHLKNALEQGLALTLSPDSVVSWVDERDVTAGVLEVLENADYTVVDNAKLVEWSDKYVNDVATYADELNRLYALGDYFDEDTE